MLSSHLLPWLPTSSSALRPSGLSADLCSRASEAVERYLGQGGVAAVEVEVLAAIEGDREGAAEADHGGGLWE